MVTDLVEMDLSGVATDELEAGLCSFQARLAAAAASYVLAVAEYDRRRGWEPWECRSMAHWLSWRCGTGLVAAREQVRIGHALGVLPVIRERFCAGRLSYSQVRAVTRVATPDNDEVLADLADAMTAAQLEEVVRAYRRSGRVDADTALARRAERRLSVGWDDDGMLTGRFRLPAEDGAVLLKALDVLATPADARAAGADGADDGWAAARADALVVMASRSIRGEAEGERAGEDEDNFLVTVLVDRASLATGGDDRDGTCEIDHGPALAVDTVRRLACGSPTVTVATDGEGGVLDVGRRTRRIGRRLRRALERRDGGCRFPGCTSRRTQAHHIVHWVDGGRTSMDNLVSLCSRHHHLHHEGRYRIDRPRPGRLIFVRADGRIVPDHPVRPASGRAGGALHATPAPFSSQWEGEPLSLDDVLTVLHQADAVLADRHTDDSAEASSTGSARSRAEVGLGS